MASLVPPRQTCPSSELVQLSDLTKLATMQSE